MTSISVAAEGAHASSRLYRAVWRWHFYAGLFVVPILLMLALTGAYMMLYARLSNEMGWVPSVPPKAISMSVSAQGKSALAALPGGKISTYIAPESANRPAFFEVSRDGTYYSASVDPYTGTVLDTHASADTSRALAEKIHGTFLLGTFGDRLIEVAASLTIIMTVTGIFLWWPQGEGFFGALLPRLGASGRGLWRELHKAGGIWIALFLILFILSGLSWTGIWGDSFVKPWSSFPASKWDAVPLSDASHASLNHDIMHEVPWTLEATPLPASGSNAGTPAVAEPVVLDTVVQWALVNGFRDQFKVAIPADEKGVFTVSYDGRNEDSVTPASDRYVHIDQYSGNILADVRLKDYPFVGKLMAWGIALHKGTAGVWNLVFNLAYLALVIFVCVSGVVMWWKRRPVGQLGSPKYPRGYKVPAAVLGLGALLSVLFPLGGIAIAAFAIIDFLLPQRLKQAGAN
ncbi:MAG: PepSY domain-containing protein [Rhizobiales bacterium]|nr:PepSY domain-containing protein [Hyphomicrobiales bacterium]